MEFISRKVAGKSQAKVGKVGSGIVAKSLESRKVESRKSQRFSQDSCKLTNASEWL
nr:MAG TPA: Clavanin [Herelleviridae sp.]